MYAEKAGLYPILGFKRREVNVLIADLELLLQESNHDKEFILKRDDHTPWLYMYMNAVCVM